MADEFWTTQYNLVPQFGDLHKRFTESNFLSASSDQLLDYAKSISPALQQQGDYERLLTLQGVMRTARQKKEAEIAKGAAAGMKARDKGGSKFSVLGSGLGGHESFKLNEGISILGGLQTTNQKSILGGF